MTSASFTRRLALLVSVASSLWLAGCGGSDSTNTGQTNIRALNLTSDTPSLDLYIGGNKVFSAATTATLTSSVAMDANTYAVNVNSVGDTAALFTGTYSLSEDKHYTAVVWGSQASMRVSTLPEDEDTALITAGLTRVRMFNATTETGSLDIYLTATATDISATTPTQGALTSGALSGFREIAPGTYRLRVTGAGDPYDVRLDIPALTLTTSQYSTLMLTAGAGGVLVNGALIVQQGSATIMTNTQARVRVVASAEASGIVSATVGGSTLAGGLLSPSVGPYTLITAGDVNVTMRVNGTEISNATRTFAAGADYTLLTLGSTALGHKTVLLTDDNRLPVNLTRAKLRLVNGLAGPDLLTLSVDYSPLAPDVPSGFASLYATPLASTSSYVQVTSTTAGTLFQSTALNPVSLVAQGVYTVFMLAGNTDAAGKTVPIGVIRRER
ncbi:MAG: DUF4397 domain-containing protein [Rubrivivax sp.]|nr:DUF4397 domain-containing protein [Rubrivivax sp.]